MSSFHIDAQPVVEFLDCWPCPVHYVIVAMLSLCAAAAAAYVWAAHAGQKTALLAPVFACLSLAGHCWYAVSVVQPITDAVEYRYDITEIPGMPPFGIKTAVYAEGDHWGDVRSLFPKETLEPGCQVKKVCPRHTYAGLYYDEEISSMKPRYYLVRPDGTETAATGKPTRLYLQYK